MNILFYLILGHSFGDFYLQSNEMAGNKSKHLLKHVVIYTIILELIYLLLIGSDFALIFLVVIFTSHLLIDLLNGYITNKLKDKYNWLNVIIFLTIK